MVIDSEVETSIRQNSTANKAYERAENDANAILNYELDLDMKSQGYTRKRWNTQQDERVRTTHVMADGQEVGINEPFTVGTSEMMFPCDASLGATADEIINCRCNVIYIDKKIKRNDNQDIVIHKSVGAKSYNYEVYDPFSDSYFTFAEGTKIENPKVFAGYKGVKPLKESTLEKLMSMYGGSSDKWQHAKGIGTIQLETETVLAEVHWFQEESVGRVEFKVKEWLE